ncbi:MAG: hypothetical protein LBC53_04605 [Spirochaetaceae bacterium]|nr:hypothetical protein [Spirochaetaceae bacterium]
MFFACKEEEEEPDRALDLSGYSGGSIILVDFGGEQEKKIKTGSYGSYILARVNLNDSPVEYSKTGYVASFSGGSRSASATEQTDVQAGMREPFATVANKSADSYSYKQYKQHEKAQKFNSAPPPVKPRPQGPQASIQGPLLAESPAIGTEKTFWIDKSNGTFEEKTAKLSCTTGNWELWSLIKEDGSLYIPENSGVYTLFFDAYYNALTTLLGYEYGGGPNGNGGMDGNKKIKILAYDFEEDSITGYFWGKDAYLNDDADFTKEGLKSNEAEIIYMNSKLFKSNIFEVTLIHELQHMIHFNKKVLSKNPGKQLNSSVWFNEMISMVCEDLIGPHGTIHSDTKGHPIRERMPTALQYYWTSGTTELNVNSPIVVFQYDNMYSFGAYLARNYGGPKLLQEMVNNNYVDEESILKAIEACGEKVPAGGFNEIVSNYSLALINRNTSKPTFHITSPSLKIGEFNYEFTPIILWNKQKFPNWTVFYTNTFATEATSIQFSATIPPKGFVLECENSWLDMKSEQLTITLRRPEDPNVKLYMIRL